MKKITLMLSALAATFAVSAQTFVSTTAQNKSVVLEEYTGVRCGYCPDGHKRANDFAKQNPGRVVLVNIHTGSYAAPRTGYPDFTTTDGDQIASHPSVGISGYPAGSVQRRVFANPQRSGTASSRGVWARDGAIVLGEASPVNVDLRATYDNTKNEVSVVVEAYYTANSPVATNKITVGITQDGIVGPQSGSAANPDNVLPSGEYLHNHMLRDIITPAFGETISTTTQGTFFTKTYTWPVPASIKGNKVSVQNLNAFVIIAEGDQKILTGAEGKVDLPANMKTDLEVVSKVTEPSGMCNGVLIPSFEVENKFSNAITSFKMSYTLDGGTPVVETFTGNLTQGQKATVTFPSINLPAGKISTITYQKPYDISGGYIDVNSSTLDGGEYTVVKEKAINADVKENFTGITSPDGLKANWIPFATGGLNGRTYVGSTIGTTTSPRGEAFWISLSFGQGESAGILIGEVDASGQDTVELSLATAYAQLAGGENDKVAVMVSKDCGATWTEAWSKAGSALKPFGSNNQSIIAPGAESNWSDWKVDLSEYGENMLVKIEVTSDRGNSMWLDDIGIRMAKTDFTSVAEIGNANGIEIFPNPTSDVAVVSFNGKDMTGSVVAIIDVTGKTVDTKVVSGTEVTIDVSNYDAGVYNIQVSNESAVSTSRIVVQ